MRNMNPSLDLARFTRPLLIGHRGYPALCPENTLASFEGAMQAGCDMIELDVTLTKDRKVVVIHDDTLDRTTTGKGPVRGHALAEIKALDAGSWFDARFAAERVPELWEVMELTAGRCMLNIEIKDSAFEEDFPADAIEHQVVKLVRKSGAMDRVIISSFDKRILQRIAAMDAPPAVAYISDHGADKFSPGPSSPGQRQKKSSPWVSTASSATSCGSCGRFEARALWLPRFDRAINGNPINPPDPRSSNR